MTFVRYVFFYVVVGCLQILLLLVLLAALGFLTEVKIMAD